MGLLDKLFGPPSRDNFARMVMTRVRRSGESREIIYDREQYSLHPQGGGSSILFLTNSYADYCAAPKESRSQVVDTLARSWHVTGADLPEDFGDVHPDLLPIVRSRSYFEFTTLGFQLQGHEVEEAPHQIIGEHLAVGLVYDMPTAMRGITQDDLDGWGVTLYEAMEAARHNFSQIEATFAGPEEGDGVYLSAMKDNYDATRLIMLDLIRQFNVKGDAVAMIPNRDTLIVTGADDLDGIETMIKLAEDTLQKPRPLTSMAFRLDGDDWTPWLPPVGNPHRNALKLLQVQNSDYHEQKQLLDALHEQRGEDVFVAAYSAMQHKDTGEVATYSVWAKGVLTMLPITDQIALMRDEDADPLLVDWDRVVEVAGDLMEPLGMYPERYRVAGFPDDEQLELIGGA